MISFGADGTCRDPKIFSNTYGLIGADFVTGMALLRFRREIRRRSFRKYTFRG